MDGLEGATVAVRDTLRRHLPAKLEDLRRRYHVNRSALPDPGLVEVEDRPRLEPKEWPGILVVGVGFGPVLVVDDDETGRTYHVTYNLELRLWARAERNGFEAAGLVRFRYMLAVVEVLLAGPIADDADEVAAWVTPSSIRGTANPRPILDSAARAVSNGTIALAVTIEEIRPATVLGQANTFDLTAGPLPEE